jgi:hypothetical protein
VQPLAAHPPIRLIARRFVVGLLFCRLCRVRLKQRLELGFEFVGHGAF